jgi:hypothetical protein
MDVFPIPFGPKIARREAFVGLGGGLCGSSRLGVKENIDEVLANREDFREGVSEPLECIDDAEDEISTGDWNEGVRLKSGLGVPNEGDNGLAGDAGEVVFDDTNGRNDLDCAND